MTTETTEREQAVEVMMADHIARTVVEKHVPDEMWGMLDWIDEWGHPEYLGKTGIVVIPSVPGPDGRKEWALFKDSWFWVADNEDQARRIHALARAQVAAARLAATEERA